MPKKAPEPKVEYFDPSRHAGIRMEATYDPHGNPFWRSQDETVISFSDPAAIVERHKQGSRRLEGPDHSKATDEGEWRTDGCGRKFFATRADCRYIDDITERWEYLREHAQERATAERREAERRALAEQLREATEHIDEVMLATTSMLRPVRPRAVAKSVERSRARRGARRRIA